MERLGALARLSVLDTDPEPQFDTLAKLVAGAFGVSTALISLVSEDREWFKARFGAQALEAPRAGGFGERAIAGAKVLVVADAARDPRFAKSPLVAEGLRFYAGAPLTTPQGCRVGVLCVMDRQPRETFSAADADELTRLAQGVMQALTTRAEAILGQAGVATALAERQAAERRYGLLLDNATDLILQCDNEGLIQFASPSARRWGYEARDLAGRSIYEFIHPDDLEETQTWYGQMLAGEDPDTDEQHEIRCRAGNGDWIWFEGNPVPIHDAEGGPTGFVAMLRDITEARAARLTMARSEARYRLLADSASDVILRYDIDGRIEYLSPAVRNYGFQPEDLIGRNLADMLDPEEIPRNEQFLQDLAAGRPLPRGEDNVWRTRDAAGGGVVLEGVTSPIQDDDGRVIGAMAVLRDVTQRRADEEALAASEARFRLLAEQSSDIILRTDVEGRIEYVSPACRLLGFTEAEMLGRPTIAFLDPADHGLAAARFQDLLGGRVRAVGERQEYRAVRKDGVPVLLDGTASVIRDDQGKIIGAVSHLRDVTDLKAKEQSFRMLFDDNPLSMVVIDTKTYEVVQVNDAAIAAFGWTRDDMRAVKITQFLSPDDRALATVRLGEIDRPNEPKPYIIVDGKGRQREVLPFIRPTVFDGRPALLAAVLDVTDQRAAEAALARSEAQYRLLAENATDVIATCDLEGTITYVSPSAERLYGYTTAEMVGSDAARLIHPDDRPMVMQRLREMIVSKKPDASIGYELRIVTKTGEVIWVEANPSVVCDPRTGRVIALQDCLRDISLRKRMEDELVRKRAEAEAAAVAKAEFLSNMSHELRTPLTGIIGFGGLLEAMPDLPERARTYASRLVSGGEALLAVINDILDFTKLEAGQVELDPHPFDPVAFVSKSIHLVQTEARRKGLQLRTQLDPSLPAMLTADSDRIRQVLLNLLSNAIKFTAQGQVTVAMTHEAANGGRLICRVTDTGIGIPAALAHRLFQRFSQIDGSISREYGGTGLGLAISKGLVEMMGGEIGVDSVEGAGSTFWFTVAAAAVAPAAANTAPDDVSAPAPLRILVVDDVPMNRELIVAMLEPLGALVVEAGDGLEAVSAAKASRFDLILMDLQMPGLDGYAATRQIRADCAFNRGTPILALSANVLPKHIAACREAGMDDYVAKPIDLRALLAKIAEHAPAPAPEPAPLALFAG